MRRAVSSICHRLFLTDLSFSSAPGAAPICPAAVSRLGPVVVTESQW